MDNNVSTMFSSYYGKTSIKEIKPWKIWVHFTGYLMCFVIGSLIASIPKLIIGTGNESGYLIFITEIVKIPISLVLLVLYTKYLLGLPCNRNILGFKNFDLIFWTLVGLLLPIIIFTILYLSGILTITSTNFDLSKEIILEYIIKSLGISLAAGIVEELVFRGYMINLLNKKYPLWFSTLVPSLLFTMMHLGHFGSDLNVLEVINIGILVSFLFLLIYKTSKSIWNASVVHFLWSFLFLNELVGFGNKMKNSGKFIQFNMVNIEKYESINVGLNATLLAIIAFFLVVTAIIGKIKKNRKTA